MDDTARLKGNGNGNTLGGNGKKEEALGQAAALEEPEELFSFSSGSAPSSEPHLSDVASRSDLSFSASEFSHNAPGTASASGASSRSYGRGRRSGASSSKVSGGGGGSHHQPTLEELLAASLARNNSSAHAKKKEGGGASHHSGASLGRPSFHSHSDPVDPGSAPDEYLDDFYDVGVPFEGNRTDHVGRHVTVDGRRLRRLNTTLKTGRDDKANSSRDDKVRRAAWHLGGTAPTQGPIDLDALERVHERGWTKLPRKPTLTYLQWHEKQKRVVRAEKPMPFKSASATAKATDELRRGFDPAWLEMPRQVTSAKPTSSWNPGSAGAARAQARLHSSRPRSAHAPSTRQPALFTRLDPERESWRRHHAGCDVHAGGTTSERSTSKRPLSALQRSKAAIAAAPRFPYKSPSVRAQEARRRQRPSTASPAIGRSSQAEEEWKQTLAGGRTVRGSGHNVTASVCTGENAHLKWEMYDRMKSLYKSLGINNRDTEIDGGLARDDPDDLIKPTPRSMTATEQDVDVDVDDNHNHRDDSEHHSGEHDEGNAGAESLSHNLEGKTLATGIKRKFQIIPPLFSLSFLFCLFMSCLNGTSNIEHPQLTNNISPPFFPFLFLNRSHSLGRCS